MARRVLFDTGPLRASGDFRRVFAGQTVSMVGTQLSAVGLAYQVYERTGSSLQVGAVSLVQLGPFVAGTLIGGGAADGGGRRRVIVAGSLLSAAASAGLAGNAAFGHRASVLALYLLSAFGAFLAGAVSSVTTALVPSLVGTGQLTGAFAVMQIVDQVGMVAGPALAGALIAAAGLPWLFAIDAASFVWVAGAVKGVRPPAPVPAAGTRRSPSVMAGLRYLRGQRILQGLFLVDLGATVFGLPRAVFPALVRTVLGGGPVALGLLYAAPACGALAVSLASGWLGGVRRAGKVVLGAVLVWGVAIVALGFVRALWEALVVLAVAGGADVVSAVLRSTIVQRVVSDDLRGRVSSVQMAVVEGGPRLGDLESGAVASAFSPRTAIVSGGLACVVATVVVGAALRGLRRYVVGAPDPGLPDPGLADPVAQPQQPGAVEPGDQIDLGG